MKKPIYIYGAGGLGREVLSLIHALDVWEPAGFIDDTVLPGIQIKGVPVVGGQEIVKSLGHASVVIAIGNPQIKARIVNAISGSIQFPTLLHPTAILQDVSSIKLGEGCIVTAGCILTTDIKIGKYVLINLNVTIGHDTSVGDCCSIMPGVNIAGNVTLGESILAGSGANIINGVSIGDGARIGMGAVVIRNVGAAVTVAGVPAKPI